MRFLGQNWQRVFKPHAVHAGMNSGVLLMRNTDWMKGVIQQMTHYGTQPMNITREEVGS